MNPIWLNAVRASQGVAVVPWYLAGGAPMPVAAYQPIGAASLAASYVNLANPGTFDAAPGVAPTHSGVTGWGFDGATQYLTTGVVPSVGTGSMIIRYSDINPAINNRRIIGVFAEFNRYFLIGPFQLDGRAQYANGQLGYAAGLSNSTGVSAIAGLVGYLNGSPVITLSAGVGQTIWSVYVGAANGLSGQPTFPDQTHSTQAVAIYNTTLTAPQVAAVSAAMAAL